MVKVRLIKYICYSISFILSLTLLSAQAYADTSFDSTFCNVSNLITGTPGKIVAGTVLVSTGVGFFVGKVSWGLLIASTMGIGLMFGAPTVVSAVSGETLEECEQSVVYTITNDGVSYYSCPIGYSGEDCDTCATGYTGSDCSGCDVGYVGNQCDQCDFNNGYSAYNGSCYQACSVSGITGTSVANVNPGSGSLSCNANSFFSGSISYTCDSSFSYSGACTCVNNYDISSSCTQCLDGYDINSNCSMCLSDYTNISGSCYQNYTTGNGITGISSGITLLPPHGSLSCNNDLGYGGSIDYTCNSGSLSTSGHCINQKSPCIHATEQIGLFTEVYEPEGNDDKVWTRVLFASYGTSSGCGNIGSCHASNSVAIIEAACLGRTACFLDPEALDFEDDCPGQAKHLKVMLMWGDP